MKKVILMMSLVMLAGCSSPQKIYDNYNNLVDLKNGVSQRDAKLIAQRVIVATDEQRNYRITAPDIRTDKEALKYPDFWFVVFGHNWFAPISTDPLAKTYTELKNANFLVVIDKKNGNIQFAGLWYPRIAKNFEWVFDRQAYKAHDSLAPAPYKEIQVH
jgi:hypothetical protein